MTELYRFDRELIREGGGPLCGVDEAGRGPLAGPVCAAAVILGEEPIQGLGDSKKLTPKRREALYQEITAKAAAWQVAWASHQEIDDLNILHATLLAMRRAVEGLAQAPGLVIVDGISDPALPYPTRMAAGGDGKSACVAAASILAKVSRDRLLVQLDSQYPQYQFARHKGYGTKLHYQMLDAHGPCPVHRRSFLRKWEAGR